jgi:hypothetical protein
MGMDLGRIVTFKNITNQDFTHSYHAQPFTVKAGETQVFPYDLGRHLAKHLARRMLFSDAPPDVLRVDRALFTRETEQQLMGKILGEEAREEVSVALSENELIRKRVDELNNARPEGALSGRTKADVIAEMESMNLPIDKRQSMQKLEEQLAAAKKPL